MSKKSKLIVAAAIAVFGLNSQAFSQSFSSSHGTGHELSSHFANDGDGRDAGIGHDSFATTSVTTGPAHAASCSEQIAELRQSALRNHQATPETVWQARSYAQLMFAADLTLAEAQDALGNNDECLSTARRAERTPARSRASTESFSTATRCSTPRPPASRCLPALRWTAATRRRSSSRRAALRFL